MRVYVAGASKERELVGRYMRRLENAGHLVTFDWTRDMDARAAAGQKDADLSDAQRLEYATEDLLAIARADLFWMLVPTNASVGAWAELGYALAALKATVVSGDHRRSIFCAAANEHFATHEAAFAWIVAQGVEGSSSR